MAQPPGGEWQAKARRIMDEARERLWSPDGQRAWGYRIWERGLSENIIRIARLGYLPGKPTAWREIDGLNVPCGILIPWIIDNEVWGSRCVGQRVSSVTSRWAAAIFAVASIWWIAFCRERRSSSPKANSTR